MQTCGDKFINDWNSLKFLQGIQPRGILENFEKFNQAYRGRKTWLAIQRCRPAEKYIIMPHHQEEYNDYAMMYLDDYLEKENCNTALIISSEKSMIQKANRYRRKHKVSGLFVRQEKIENILRLYALYHFSSDVVIVSLTMPYDTRAENLLGVHGVTKKELFCYDIYGFREIPQTRGDRCEVGHGTN